MSDTEAAVVIFIKGGKKPRAGSRYRWVFFRSQELANRKYDEIENTLFKMLLVREPEATLWTAVCCEGQLP